MALFSEYRVGDTATGECDKERDTPFMHACLRNRRGCAFSHVGIQCEQVILRAPQVRQKVRNADIAADVTLNTVQLVYLTVPSL